MNVNARCLVERSSHWGLCYNSCRFFASWTPGVMDRPAKTALQQHLISTHTELSVMRFCMAFCWKMDSAHKLHWNIFHSRLVLFFFGLILKRRALSQRIQCVWLGDGCRWSCSKSTPWKKSSTFCLKLHTSKIHQLIFSEIRVVAPGNRM